MALFAKPEEKPMRMNPRLRLPAILFLLVLGPPASIRAQVIEGVRPAKVHLEAFAGYAYMRSATAVSGAPINLNGTSFVAAFYVKNWLALAGDVGFYHQGSIAASGLGLTVSSYQIGPRVSIRNRTHLTPFGHFLLGAGHAGGTLYTTSLGAGLSPLGPNNGFLYTAGAGADWKLSPKIAIRLVETDYLHSQFLNGNGNRQGNLRLSTGIVFRLGNN